MKLVLPHSMSVSVMPEGMRRILSDSKTNGKLEK